MRHNFWTKCIFSISEKTIYLLMCIFIRDCSVVSRGKFEHTVFSCVCVCVFVRGKNWRAAVGLVFGGKAFREIFCIYIQKDFEAGLNVPWIVNLKSKNVFKKLKSINNDVKTEVRSKNRWTLMIAFKKWIYWKILSSEIHNMILCNYFSLIWALSLGVETIILSSQTLKM